MKNGKVEINLDRKRYLRFDFNAWCAVEDAFGKSLAEVGNPMTQGLRGQRAMLYGGLLADDPMLTVQRAGEFFDSHDRSYIAAQLSAAIKDANPEAKGPNVEGLEGGTGTNSTEQPAA